jgi:hypothetical protein
MSEDEAKRIAGHEEETDEVEAHKAKAAAANAEPAAEGDDDEVEAHRKLV